MLLYIISVKFLFDMTFSDSESLTQTSWKSICNCKTDVPEVLLFLSNLIFPLKAVYSPYSLYSIIREILGLSTNSENFFYRRKFYSRNKEYSAGRPYNI